MDDLFCGMFVRIRSQVLHDQAGRDKSRHHPRHHRPVMIQVIGQHWRPHQLQDRHADAGDRQPRRNPYDRRDQQPFVQVSRIRRAEVFMNQREVLAQQWIPRSPSAPVGHAPPEFSFYRGILHAPTRRLIPSPHLIISYNDITFGLPKFLLTLSLRKTGCLPSLGSSKPASNLTPISMLPPARRVPFVNCVPRLEIMEVLARTKPDASVGPHSSTTGLRKIPTPSTPTSTTLPATTGPTPSGVPVAIKSPGRRVINSQM